MVFAETVTYNAKTTNYHLYATSLNNHMCPRKNSRQLLLSTYTEAMISQTVSYSNYFLKYFRLSHISILQGPGTYAPTYVIVHIDQIIINFTYTYVRT